MIEQLNPNSLEEERGEAFDVRLEVLYCKIFAANIRIAPLLRSVLFLYLFFLFPKVYSLLYEKEKLIRFDTFLLRGGRKFVMKLALIAVFLPCKLEKKKTF